MEEQRDLLRVECLNFGTQIMWQREAFRRMGVCGYCTILWQSGCGVPQPTLIPTLICCATRLFNPLQSLIDHTRNATPAHPANIALVISNVPVSCSFR